MNDNKFKRNDWIAIIILCLIIGCLCVHSQYSFCQTDEPFYISAVKRLYQGDRLILDEWHPTQFYTPILLPLYAFYALFVPSLKGILLYFRIVDNLFAGFVSVMWYKTMKKKHGIGLSLTTACIFLLFSRANISGPSYYNLCMRFVILFWTLVVFSMHTDISSRRQKLYGWLAGGFLSLAVLCQPYLAVFVVAAMVVLLSIKKTRKKSISFCIGILCMALLYFIFFLTKGNIGEYFRNLKYILSDPEHQTAIHNRIGKIGYVFLQSNSYFVIFCVAVSCVWIMIMWWKKKTIFNGFWCFQLIVCGLSIIKPLLRIHEIPCYAFLGAFAFSIFPSVLSVVLNKKWEESVMLYVVGLAVAGAFAMGSNTGYDAVQTGLCISAAAGILLMGNHLNIHFSKRQINGKMPLAVLCVIMLVFMGLQHWFGIYKDASMPLLTERLEDGPAAGLLTSEENARQYRIIYQTLQNESIFQDHNAKIIHSKHAPWAYLCRGNECGAATTWMCELSNPQTEEYMDTHPAQSLYVCVYDEGVGFNLESPFNRHIEERHFNAQKLEGSFYELILFDGNKVYQDEYLTVYYLKR